MIFKADKFREIEKILHNIEKMILDCEEKLTFTKCIIGISAINDSGIRTQGRGDKVANQAVAIVEAETQLKHLLAMRAAIAYVKKLFEDDEARVLFELYYGQNKTIQDVADKLHCHKKKIFEMRNKIVAVTGIVLVEKGLYKYLE